MQYAKLVILLCKFSYSLQHLPRIKTSQERINVELVQCFGSGSGSGFDQVSGTVSGFGIGIRIQEGKK
jgi:hypothetical protein